MTVELEKEPVVVEEQSSPAASPSPQAELYQPAAPTDAVFVISRTTVNYVVIAIVFLIIGVVIGVTLISPMGSGGVSQAMLSTSIAQAIDSAGLVRASPTPGPVAVSLDDDPAWGAEDAPIVIVEFSDFQCPYCLRFYQQTYPKLKETYGQYVRFVFRDFPLTQIHPDAQRSAEAAECAKDQGKFWEYHDILFENQSDLSQAGLVRYASELGLNAETFTQCLTSGSKTEEVTKDLQEGVDYGIRGTPTFFINGRPLVGAQPYEVFAQVIDEELNRLGIGSG